MYFDAYKKSEDEVTTMVAPVIVWGGVVILGIFTGAALYFSSKYMTHVEKQNLINRCYDMGGTPSLDSGDTGAWAAHPGRPGGRYPIRIHSNVKNRGMKR